MAVLGKVVITPKGEYSNNVSYENLDCVFDGGSTWLAKQATKGNPPPTDGSESNDYWQLLARGVPIDIKDSTVTFEEASENDELQSGDKLSNLIGLMKKKFADIFLSLANKLSQANIANNLVTTESGFVLDARQGKILQDQINDVNNNLGKYNHTYPDSFAGQTLTQVITDFVNNNYKSAFCFYWMGELQPPDTVQEIANSYIDALYEFYKLTTTNYIFIRVTTSTAIYSKLMRIHDSQVLIPWVKATNTLV